jgi:hypothetical protein
MQLPPYLQHIAKALMRDHGYSMSRAIAIARNATRRWKRGGGHVRPEVRAASTLADVQWEAKRARAHAVHGTSNTGQMAVELTGFRTEQPRDRNGRWTRGPGSLGARMIKASVAIQRELGHKGPVNPARYDRAMGRMNQIRWLDRKDREKISPTPVTGHLNAGAAAAYIRGTTWPPEVKRDALDLAPRGPLLTVAQWNHWAAIRMRQRRPVQLSTVELAAYDLHRPRPWKALTNLTVRELRKLASQVHDDHPAMMTAQHVTDAADALERGNVDSATRHLAAAMHTLTPMSLHRHGLVEDTEFTAAKANMDAVNRGMLLLRDIQDQHAHNEFLDDQREQAKLEADTARLARGDQEAAAKQRIAELRQQGDQRMAEILVKTIAARREQQPPSQAAGPGTGAPPRERPAPAGKATVPPTPTPTPSPAGR